ncbi:uncharacterized protein B0I36DRAFT_246935 [Microdochium trichocladiopsis]|uniref:NAD(P)-binding protein n=1 Tax=Microdochium trichocladiopsis TaxID=1682393 RepID=A0A9P8Y2V9_9PEZI|nr:uncharacterized protein B0I36DRAFT_246935 [Microdochium trichocladiopsis]KAH7028096.1 hypothetical protein B0I36DRAFT_246935 [Microdochium trichocladiopsis]
MAYNNKVFTISPSQLTSPTNKTALITGGSSGIGLQTALLLHSLGNNVVIVDLQALLASPRYLFHEADVTVWASQRAAFEAAVARFGRIDLVHVNAGIAEYGDQFFDETLDQDGLLAEPDRRCVDVCLHAADDTVRLAAHYLRRNNHNNSGSNDKKKGVVVDGGAVAAPPAAAGSIVITASLAGYLASAGAPLYSAAKHGVVGLMRALKRDLATLGIAISVVAPGITVTPILAASRDARDVEAWVGRMRASGVPINTPQEVAACVVWLMGLGMEGNGKGMLVQKGLVADLEAGIAATRAQWMGQEMLDLFRGGRTAPYFPNKL